jgi:predicted nuclease with TOPRIM domain
MSDHRKRRKGEAKLVHDLFSEKVKAGDLRVENAELHEEVARLLMRMSCLQSRIEELEGRPFDVQRWLSPVTESPWRASA